MSESFTCASVSITDSIAEVTLTATGKANRMGPDFWDQLPRLFAQLSDDDAVRAIVLRGSGEHFSFGLDLVGMSGDLGELLQPEAGAAARQRLLATIRRMQGTISSVARCRKPVVAAIHGWCIGGAVDLITACDVRVASADAKFSVREVKMGMVADVGTLARLPLIIGQGHARELALTGDDVDAAKALRIGLVNEVLPSADALFAHARALATRIARNSPLVTAGIKEVLNAHAESAASHNLATVALWNSAFLPSKDVNEAIGAFIEKREPTFTGS